MSGQAGRANKNPAKRSRAMAGTFLFRGFYGSGWDYFLPFFFDM